MATATYDPELERLRRHFGQPWKFTRVGARIRAERGTYVATRDTVGEVSRQISEWLAITGQARA